MILLICNRCKSAIRTAGEFREVDYLIGTQSEWFPDRYPCWTVGCDGKAIIAEGLDPELLAALRVHDLTPQEAFSALHQMGLPEEQECGPIAVRKAFESPVKHIDLRFVPGTKRSIINHVELEDGTRVFLASAPEGPMVYRIARPHSYAKEFLDEQQARAEAR